MLLKSITRNLSREDWIIPAILYANVGMFVLSLLIHPQKTGFSLNPLTFLSPDNGSLILLGATGTIPIHRFGRWWTLISANYLHGSILHIFFNMMAFRQIAPLIRNQFGGSRMIIIYTLSGMAGFWTSSLGGGMLSGALCGVLLGYREKSAQNSLHHLAAGILVLATAGVLLWAVLSGFYIQV